MSEDANPGTSGVDGAPDQAPKAPKTRKPRTAKAKSKPKGTLVKVPVINLFAVRQPVEGDKEQIKLKAMTHTAAVAEVLKLAGTTDKAEAEKWAGAGVSIVALMDTFTVDSQIKVTVGVKR